MQRASLLAKLAEPGAIPAMEYMLDVWDGDIEYTPDPLQADGPLLSAVKANAIGAVNWLLERDANRDVKDGLGRTPLQVARKDGIQALVMMLQKSRRGGRQRR